jgi:putative nucleotidyltransferase with HDIG domain
MTMTDQAIKILVVDDEEGIRDVTEGYFTRKGYEVYTAENGAQALDIINEEPQLSCIFTDINMPLMDGLELAEKIRQIENTLPVVVMTGYPSLENTIQTLKNGVVDYLIKPVNLEQMELTLRRILRERELFVENLILKEEVARQVRLKELNNQLVERVKEVNTLNRVMEDFSSTDSSHGVFNKVVELGVEELHADKVFCHIFSERTRDLIQVASACPRDGDYQLPDGFVFDIPDRIKSYIKERAAEGASPFLMPDAAENSCMDTAVQSFMMVPLRIRENVFGVASAFIFEKDRIFNEKDIYYMNFITRKAAAAIENIALYENIYDNLFATLFAFVAALEVRDFYTRRHSTRVARYAHKIAKEMECSQEELDVINFAGMLHDIGKIGIRDDILLKPGPLTDEEYEKIKEHPAIGADIISKLGLWDREVDIIRHHHERFDGNGYPDGLSGETIPRLARIMSVADCFDAMASNRPYRERMEKSLVLKIIRENSGTQFDPNVVAAFFRIVHQIDETE